jgi:hypothetical protein
METIMQLIGGLESNVKLFKISSEVDIEAAPFTLRVSLIPGIKKRMLIQPVSTILLRLSSLLFPLKSGIINALLLAIFMNPGSPLLGEVSKLPFLPTVEITAKASYL